MEKKHTKIQHQTKSNTDETSIVETGVKSGLLQIKIKTWIKKK